MRNNEGEKVKRKRRGMPVLLLGLVLLALGSVVLLGVDEVLEYILPAPAGDALTAYYEAGQEQLLALSDSLTACGIGARRQDTEIVGAREQHIKVTLYAVGEGYFDAVHETLRDGRLITGTDVRRAASVIVLDERAARVLFAGDDPLGRTVQLSGTDYEVAGVIAGGKRIGETDEYVAYLPITTAGANALNMQTISLTARCESTSAASILMHSTLSSWQPGGSFYDYGKRRLGAVMPLRWCLLLAGVSLLLSLLARMNAFAMGRICRINERLQTEYLRNMLPALTGSVLCCMLGYGALAGAAFCLARFGIAPLYVFTEWVPEVVVELSSLSSRFWALNVQSSAAVRYVSASLCRLELGQGFVRWGLLAVLLGLGLGGVPLLNREVILPRIRRER